MKKIILLVSISFTLLNCKSYRNEFKDYENDLFPHVKEKFLKHHNAEDAQFSVVAFEFGFSGEKHTVKNNNKIIYDDVLTTNPNLGHAKYITIDNRYDTKIIDNSTGKNITIDRDLAAKHKFITVTRKRKYLMSSGLVHDSIVNGQKVKTKDKLYKITYSNTIRGLM